MKKFKINKIFLASIIAGIVTLIYNWYVLGLNGLTTQIIIQSLIESLAVFYLSFGIISLTTKSRKLLKSPGIMASVITVIYLFLNFAIYNGESSQILSILVFRYVTSFLALLLASRLAVD